MVLVQVINQEISFILCHAGFEIVHFDIARVFHITINILTIHLHIQMLDNYFVGDGLLVDHHKLAKVPQLADVPWPVLAQKVGTQCAQVQFVVDVVFSGKAGQEETHE